MASKAKYHQERLMKIGTPTQRRCARCNRKIKGQAHMLEGKYYGSECVQKAYDLMNNQGRSE